MGGRAGQAARDASAGGGGAVGAGRLGASGLRGSGCKDALSRSVGLASPATCRVTNHSSVRTRNSQKKRASTFWLPHSPRRRRPATRRRRAAGALGPSGARAAPPRTTVDGAVEKRGPPTSRPRAPRRRPRGPAARAPLGWRESTARAPGSRRLVSASSSSSASRRVASAATRVPGGRVRSRQCAPRLVDDAARRGRPCSPQSPPRATAPRP